jgi:hypothetical protein
MRATALWAHFEFICATVSPTARAVGVSERAAAVGLESKLAKNPAKPIPKLKPEFAQLGIADLHADFR